jgi:hypothetical protein
VSKRLVEGNIPPPAPEGDYVWVSHGGIKLSIEEKSLGFK